MDLIFAVHKLGNISANPGKVHFEGLVHLLRYIRENKTLGLEYYEDIYDAPVPDLFRQVSIETENHLMPFSDPSWQDSPDTVRSTRAYIIFYQGGTIDHDTHVPEPVAQSSAESEHNTSCNAGMALAHSMILVHDFLNKDTDIVPEEAPLIMLDSKSAMCMDKNGKYTKHTRHIARIIHF